MRLPFLLFFAVVLAVTAGPYPNKQVYYWWCPCGLRWYMDPLCITAINATYQHEFDWMCQNNSFPLGSWGPRTTVNSPVARNVKVAYNTSYMITDCYMTSVMRLTQFYGTGCSGRVMWVNMIPTNEQCLPIILYGDLLYVTAACGASALKLSFSLLTALLLLWVGFYSV